MIDVVVVNYNNWKETAEYIHRINDFSCIDHIVVVDNNSSNNSYKELSRLSDEKTVVVKTDKNGGYGYGNNFGVKYAIENFSSTYIAITNPDVYYNNDCIQNCVCFLENHPDYALVSPTMKNPDGQICKCAWNLPKWYELVFSTFALIGKKVTVKFLPYDISNSFQTCECVKGSMLVIRSSVFNEIGGYDQKIFLYSEENVLGFKLKKKNYKSAVLSNEFFIHARGTTISKIYKRNYSKKKLIIQSRMVLLRDYYKLGTLKMYLINFLYKLSLFESKVIDYIKVKR